MRPFAQNGQDRKLAFVNASSRSSNDKPGPIAALASSYVVQAGNIIPASLVTGIRSDLPGQIAAQVTENVHDSPTGRFLLDPAGSTTGSASTIARSPSASRASAGLDPPDHAERSLNRAGASAWRRYIRLFRSRGRGRQSIGSPCSRRRSCRRCSALAVNLGTTSVPAAIVMSSRRSVEDPAIA